MYGVSVDRARQATRMDDETLVEDLITVRLLGGPVGGQTRQIDADCREEGVIIRMPQTGEAAHYAPDHDGSDWVFQGWVLWEEYL